jgi:glutamine synthetase
MKFYLEYVWVGLDSTLYSKVKIVNINKFFLEKEDIDIWNFDGSSTGQSETKKSDILIRPVKIYENPFINYMKGYLILCECLNPDESPHETNFRHPCVITENINKKEEFLFGIEQEYSMFERIMGDENKIMLPYGWLNEIEPIGIRYGQSGYCGVGSDKIFSNMRKITEEHMEKCLNAGISICGMNMEVSHSSAEFQIGTCDALTVCDDLHMARYILLRVAESYNVIISFHPKPFGPEFNGCGCHTNISTKNTREDIKYIYDAITKIKYEHGNYNECYGSDNDLRLTGNFETSDMNKFTYGVGDRTGTIRIPLQVNKDGKGYFEYRFPASNMDPYRGVENLMWIIGE